MGTVPRRRGRNLDAGRVSAIVRLIGRLLGNPTWQDVVDAVHRELGTAYTRQTLHAHEAVRLAYGSRRAGSAAKPGARPLPKLLSAARARAAASEIELGLARRREDAFIETFARWLYNSRAHGVTEEMLNKPLPPSHRS